MDDQRDLRLRVFALETALAALLRSPAVDEDALPRSTARFLEATYAQRRYPELLLNGHPKTRAHDAGDGAEFAEPRERHHAGPRSLPERAAGVGRAAWVGNRYRWSCSGSELPRVASALAPTFCVLRRGAVISARSQS